MRQGVSIFNCKFTVIPKGIQLINQREIHVHQHTIQFLKQNSIIYLLLYDHKNIKYLPRNFVHKYITANPTHTDMNCKTPALRFRSCQRARSRGRTSLTVTQKSVPAARAWNSYIFVCYNINGFRQQWLISKPF